MHPVASTFTRTAGLTPAATGFNVVQRHITAAGRAGALAISEELLILPKFPFDCFKQEPIADDVVEEGG